MTTVERLLQGLARFRYLFLVLIAVLLCAGSVHRLTGDSDWQFFSWGSDQLFGQHRPFVRASGVIAGDQPGGLHLYGSYPFLQIGPPALLLAAAIQALPGSGLTIAAVVIQALGLLAVVAIERATCQERTVRTRLAVLVGGAVTTIAWAGLTHYRHLDDALALACLATAAWCLRRDRVLAAGVLLGVGAACKPWAVVLLALALVPATRGDRLRCAIAAALSAAVWWLPFVVADHRTLQLGQVSPVLSRDSALLALHLSRLPSPQEVRLIQLVGGLVLAVVLVLLRRWPVAVLVAFAWRLLVEPSSYPYYGVALVVAALLADLMRDRFRAPVLTVLAAGGWALAQQSSGTTGGTIRLATCLILVVAALLPVNRVAAAPSG